MASKTIRGLTVEIGGDTKKLSEALKEPEKRLKSLQTELTDVNKLLRFDPSSTDALTHKTELLSKAIGACSDKLKELAVFEQKMASMENRTEKEEEQYRALQREIMETESKMSNYEKQLRGTYTALGKLGDAGDEVQEALRKMKEEAEASKTPLDHIADSMKELNTKSSSLSKELREIDSALKSAPNNAVLLKQKYDVLKEATQNCAEKLKTLEEAEREVQAQFQKGEASSAQVRELKREIIETRSQMERYEASIKETGDAYTRLAFKSSEVADDIDEIGDEAEETTRELKKMDDASDKVSGLKSAAEKASDGFTTMKAVVADLISEALQEMVELLKEAAKYMAQTGMEFGGTMSKVKALIDEEERSAENMEKLTQLAMDMGAKTKFSANESAEAMTFLAQAGWGVEEIMAGLPGVMNLAATDGIELAQAAEITAQALNALGDGADKSSDFADILAVTSAATCTNVEEMGYAFQYVGPVAGALGFEMDELAVAIGAMADAGITGQKAGTSLRSLFTNMAKPTKQMATAMEKYGISLTDAKGNMLPLTDIMSNLRDVFSGLTEEQKTNLAATIAGKTGMAGLLSIVNTSDKDFKDLQDAIAGAGGAAEDMATIMQDNLAGDVEKLRGAFETLSVSIMQKFDLPLRDAVQAITTFLDGGMSLRDLLVVLTDVFADMGTKFQEYMPTLMQMGQDLLIYIVNGITVGLPTLMSAATDLVANLCSFIAQNAPTIVNIASDLLTSFVQGIFNFIPTLIEGAAQIVASLGQGIGQNAQNFVSKGLDLLDGFADKLTSAFPKLITAGMDFILNLVKGLVQAIPEFVQRAPEIISKFANLINDNFPIIFKKGAQIVWELIKGVGSMIVELVKNWKSVLKACVDVWEAFNWLNLGKKCLQLMSKGLKAAWGLIKEAATGAKDTLVNVLKNLPSTLKTLGTNAIKFFSNAIKGGWSWVKSGINTIKDGIINALMNLPDKMYDIACDLVRGLWRGISSMASWICEKVMGWGGMVINAVKAIFQEHSPSRVMANSGKNLVLGLAEGIDDNAKKAIKSAENLATNVLDGASMDGLALERDLQNRTIKHAMSVTTAADSSMLGKLDKILTAIEQGQVIKLDSKALVGGTATMYDNALGQRRMLAARGAV